MRYSGDSLEGKESYISELAAEIDADAMAGAVRGLATAATAGLGGLTAGRVTPV